MATIIAARKPYNFTHITTDLTLSIDAEYTENSGATSGITTYNITKTSVNQQVPESLTVNLSPFASDLFTHTPKSLSPTGIEAPVIGAQIDLRIYGNIVSDQFFSGFDGWVVYTTNTVGVASKSTVKNVSIGTPSYISAKLSATKTIIWTTDGGNSESIENPDYGVNIGSVFPVIPSGLTISDTDRTFIIEGKTDGDALLWTLYYQIVCPYDATYSIGFINRYGVWEFVDMMGRRDDSLDIDRTDYVRYDTGQYQNYNINANRKLELNTGWVDDAFKATLEDLLLSEYTILYTGVLSTSTVLAVTDTSQSIDTQRGDKMINYKIEFKEAGQIIDIV